MHVVISMRADLAGLVPGNDVSDSHVLLREQVASLEQPNMVSRGVEKLFWRFALAKAVGRRGDARPYHRSKACLGAHQGDGIATMTADCMVASALVRFRRILGQLPNATQARAGEKAHLAAIVEGEHTAAAWHDIDNQFGVFPYLELQRTDVDRRTADVSQQNVAVADKKVASAVAHRRGTVTAPD
jgi:hypothetical protein